MLDEEKVIDDQTVNEDKTEENESSDEQQEDIKSTIAQKEHFRQKSKKLEEELVELRSKLKVVDTNKTTPKTDNQDIDIIKSSIKKLEFAQAHPDIEPGDIQQVLDLANLNNKTPEEALELPMIKTYLSSKKAEKQVADAIPTNSRSPKVKPEKPQGEMSRDEHKKYFEKVVGIKQ
jgi:hypothetical protein|tara:strand:+ start:1219 stop:1746 length:528 start_codon:yes stop_codon:yes gene_type:complete